MVILYTRPGFDFGRDLDLGTFGKPFQLKCQQCAGQAAGGGSLPPEFQIFHLQREKEALLRRKRQLIDPAQVGFDQLFCLFLHELQYSTEAAEKQRCERQPDYGE